MPSRRDVLRAGGLALTASLAGCYTGAFPWSTVTVSVREDFASDAPVEVPVSVDIELQNVDDKRVAMRGVHVALFDAERRRIGLQRLGDFSWKGAPESQRETSEEDVTVGSQTVYYVEFSERATLSTDQVPEWVTVRIGELVFDGESAIDAAKNTSPPPKLRATLDRYQGARPAPSTVSTQVYDPVGTINHSGVAESGVVLPVADTETPTESATPTESGTENETSTGTANAPSNDSTAETTPTATEGSEVG